MEKTLLIMAAGMGSRFGGLKQIEPIGPNGEFLIDYSIYDAIKVGFTKVVFIIKEENYEVFKETIGARIDDKIPVEYVFQKLENIPNNFTIPEDRIKPWGTAHAILCAKNKINEPFAVINADDFYGRDAYLKVSEFLDNNKDEWACIGYNVNNTLSQFGPAKRGVCSERNGYLIDITESSVEKINGVIIAEPLSGDKQFVVDDNSLVSMNMFGFTPDLFNVLENQFIEFFNQTTDLIKGEFLIPEVVKKCIFNKEKNVVIKNTTAKWLGMTYQEDKQIVIDEIKKMVIENEYPNQLWD